MIDKGLLEEMGCELNLKQWATDKGVHFWEGTKTTLRFNNSLEGLTEFSKAVIFTVTVCYSKRIQIESHNRKRLTRQGLGEFQAGAASCLFSVEPCGQHFASPSNDVSTLKECCQPGTHTPAMEFRIFTGVGYVDMLTACVADHSLQPLQS